MISDTEFGNL